MGNNRQRDDCQTDGGAEVADCGPRPAHGGPSPVTATCELSECFWLAEPLQRAIHAQDFGQLLRAFRQAHYPTLTQGTVAALIGITQGQVSRIERGLTPVRDLNKLDQWTRTLKVPQQYLWFKNHPKSLSSDTLVPNEAREGGEDVRRRQLLRTAGLGAALLGSAFVTPDPTTLQTVQADNNAPLNIDFMRDTTATFRQLDINTAAAIAVH